MRRSVREPRPVRRDRQAKPILAGPGGRRFVDRAATTLSSPPVRRYHRNGCVLSGRPAKANSAVHASRWDRKRSAAAALEPRRGDSRRHSATVNGRRMNEKRSLRPPPQAPLRSAEELLTKMASRGQARRPRPRPKQAPVEPQPLFCDRPITPITCHALTDALGHFSLLLSHGRWTLAAQPQRQVNVGADPVTGLNLSLNITC